MTCKGWIDDGMTCDGMVRGVPGLYPDVRFKYRILTALERAAVFGKQRASSGSEAELLAAQVVAKRILQWDIPGKHTGETLPITAENCGRLVGPLLNRLFLICTGDQAVDVEDGEVPPEGPSGEDETLTRLIEGN